MSNAVKERFEQWYQNNGTPLFVSLDKLNLMRQWLDSFEGYDLRKPEEDKRIISDLCQVEEEQRSMRYSLSIIEKRLRALEQLHKEIYE